MQEIPETGGGLSGFIAWLLWGVYQYFPFEGTWDWLLLIVFLAVLARCIMVPVWWRLVERPGQSKADREGLFASLFLGDLLWPWLVIWLFNTHAGHTFLRGRSLQPLEVAEGVYWLSLVYHVAAFFAGAAMIDLSDSCRDDAGGLLVEHSFVAAAAHVLFWYWSVASLAVFVVFSVTAVLTAVIMAGLRHYFGTS